ncbi:MAG TPA: hypothetical protein VHA82_05850 [Ramlibacter sp.]|uniref:hypothetical protein n=1 Tax=Ramlibacter sp. TaxID=1917967 RepID=UPI002C52F724|nr:hypothetical protein [Ramlibacter sp.]HVZ43315.1 hypothetical protein [Ramlibacter sp.]
MSPLDFLDHLANFAAPALAVAVGVALAARLLGLDRRSGGRWWAPIALDFIAGLVVLAAGLGYFGHDGKMATYAAMAVAVASAQWAVGRSWNR